jgi:predicted glycoside hydrolase/deacetylase ChbG (UPF0249 family)
MVFMQDSERAADIAQESAIDTGLHLNFTEPFTVPQCTRGLLERQCKVATFLLRYRLAQVFFHPGLVRSFEYIVKAQVDEFRRLYGAEPERLDGHHHMHLCANVLRRELLPHGTLVRRNFCFQPGEKGFFNRLYRKSVDRRLARRHRVVDFLFPLSPLARMERLRRIFSLARESVVELETHPINPEEYTFLTGEEILRQLGDVRISARFPAIILYASDRAE